MPESRKRGGKKAHNRRIVARNNYKKHEAKRITEEFNRLLKEAQEKKELESQNNTSI
jgi:hypothetical protein